MRGGQHGVTRRHFLRLGLGTTAAAALAACGATPTPQVIEKEVTTIVEKEVTKIVEGTPQVVVQTEVVQVEVTPTPVPAATLKPGEKVELELFVFSYGSARVVARFQTIADGFMALYPQYDVKLMIVPENANEVLLTMIAGDDPPDVFMVDAYRLAEFSTKGILLDLTDHVRSSTKMAWDELLPGEQAQVTYNGRIWGTPWDYNGTMYLINLTLFEKAGIEPPSWDWTHQDLEALAVKLTDLDAHVFGASNAVAYLEGSPEYAWMKNWTGHYWLNDERTQVLIADEPTAEMYTWHQKLSFDDKVLPSPQNQLLPGTGGRQGMIAMYDCWWNEPYYVALGLKDLGADQQWTYTVRPYPKGPAGGQEAVAYSNMQSIAHNCKHPEDAWLLAEYIASKEAQESLVKVGAKPVYADPKLWQMLYEAGGVDSSLMDDIVTGQQRIMTEYAVAQTFWPSYQKICNIYQAQVDLMFQDERKDAATALSEAAAEMQAVLDASLTP